MNKKNLLKKVTSSKIKVYLALIPASLVLVSCTNSDINTAQEFSAASNALQQLNTDVAKDIYNSCIRSNTWLAKGTSGSRQNMRDALKICDKEFRPNSVRTEQAGRILVEYFKAIGALATEDRNAVKTRFEGIGTELQALKGLKPDTIKTGLNITTFLSNLILSDFRRENLKTAVVCTDNDIQIYSTGLSNFIDELYVKELLDEEIDSVMRYSGGYRSPLTNKTNLLLEAGSPEVFTSLQEIQLKRDQTLRTEISKVIDKKNTGSAYVTLIQATATAHADLKRIFNNGKNNLSPELTAKCKEYTNRKINDVTFLKQEISQSELVQVKEVAKAYAKKITPILASIKGQSK